MFPLKHQNKKDFQIISGGKMNQLIRLNLLNMRREICPRYLNNVKFDFQLRPPLYDITQMKTKVALFTGGNDWLATPKDILRYLLPQLQNMMQKKHIKAYNHLDFIWGTDANEFIYKSIVAIFDNPYTL